MNKTDNSRSELDSSPAGTPLPPGQLQELVRTVARAVVLHPRNPPMSPLSACVKRPLNSLENNAGDTSVQREGGKHPLFQDSLNPPLGEYWAVSTGYAVYPTLSVGDLATDSNPLDSMVPSASLFHLISKSPSAISALKGPSPSISSLSSAPQETPSQKAPSVEPLVVESLAAFSEAKVQALDLEVAALNGDTSIQPFLEIELHPAVKEADVDRLSQETGELKTSELSAGELENYSPIGGSTGDRSMSVDNCSKTEDWMDYMPNLTSDGELAAIFSDPSLVALPPDSEPSNGQSTHDESAASDRLQEESEADSELHATAKSTFQVKLSELISAQGHVQQTDTSAGAPETSVARIPAETLCPSPIRQSEPIRHFDLEEFLNAAVRQEEMVDPTQRQQEIQTEVHDLRGKIDIMELREEKLHIKMSNFVCEIDQLNEQNALLENLVQDLPDIYRRKFRERMKPIRERIARIQKENLRLHEDINWLTQKLAENALPPAENRRTIKLPKFGRRLPLLPNAVGQ